MQDFLGGGGRLLRPMVAWVLVLGLLGLPKLLGNSELEVSQESDG